MRFAVRRRLAACERFAIWKRCAIRVPSAIRGGFAIWERFAIRVPSAIRGRCAAHRQAHDERGPAAGFALHARLTAVPVDDRRDDGEPEPAAGAGALARRIGPVEGFEHMQRLFGLEARPLVGDAQDGFAVLRVQSDRH